MNFNEFKTEKIGISAEIAIAEYFNLYVNPYYKIRGNEQIIQSIKPLIKDIFDNNEISYPKELVAEGQNLVDFILTSGETLSIKTNQKKLGKVAPQKVGQPTAKTFFQYFEDLIEDNIPANKEEQRRFFKWFIINNIDVAIKRYWEWLFNCDYILYFYNFLNKDNSLNKSPKYIVLDKMEMPELKKENFSFTQSLETWNESNTVKYNGISIGEFQVHNNRDCFKFRFNIANLHKVIESLT